MPKGSSVQRLALLALVHSLGGAVAIVISSSSNRPQPRVLDLTAGRSRSQSSVGFAGEFHEGFRSRQDPAKLLQTDRCRNFYKIPDLVRSDLVYDNVTRLFRPSRELLQDQEAGPSLGEQLFQRMLTFEDVNVPMDFHNKNFSRIDGWCENFAVRTAQRPVKVITAKTKAGKTLMMPAIWKCATTTLTKMFLIAKLPQNGSATDLADFKGPHDESGSYCHQANTSLVQCQKHTTFGADAAGAEIKAAVVRSPLDRFLASVYEHNQWRNCSGEKPITRGLKGSRARKAANVSSEVCETMVAAARDQAAQLLGSFPHSYRSCHHPSQSYFLSATDANGNPFNWDLIVRLEDFDSGINTLNNMLGIAPAWIPTDNDSGDKRLKQMYFDAIFSDKKTACSVCKVYAQDFECLGYEMPEQCTRENCQAVGISLP